MRIAAFIKEKFLIDNPEIGNRKSAIGNLLKE